MANAGIAVARWSDAMTAFIGEFAAQNGSEMCKDKVAHQSGDGNLA